MLLLREADHLRREIDPDRLAARSRQRDQQMSRPVTDLQHARPAHTIERGAAPRLPLPQRHQPRDGIIREGELMIEQVKSKFDEAARERFFMRRRSKPGFDVVSAETRFHCWAGSPLEIGKGDQFDVQLIQILDHLRIGQHRQFVFALHVVLGFACAVDHPAGPGCVINSLLPCGRLARISIKNGTLTVLSKNVTTK